MPEIFLIIPLKKWLLISLLSYEALYKKKRALLSRRAAETSIIILFLFHQEFTTFPWPDWMITILYTSSFIMIHKLSMRVLYSGEEEIQTSYNNEKNKLI